jgi:hypothetical protein
MKHNNIRGAILKAEGVLTCCLTFSSGRVTRIYSIIATTSFRATVIPFLTLISLTLPSL